MLIILGVDGLTRDSLIIECDYNGMVTRHTRHKAYPEPGLARLMGIAWWHGLHPGGHILLVEAGHHQDLQVALPSLTGIH